MRKVSCSSYELIFSSLLCCRLTIACNIIYLSYIYKKYVPAVIPLKKPYKYKSGSKFEWKLVIKNGEYNAIAVFVVHHGFAM